MQSNRGLLILSLGHEEVSQFIFGQIAECSKLNRHVQMKVAERGMNDSDEEF